MRGTAAHSSNIRKAQGLRARRRLAFTAVVALGPVSHAGAQDDVRARMRQMENDIQTLNRAVYKGETPPQPTPSLDVIDSSSSAQAQQQVRLSQMESDIARLTGRLEEQQHLIENLQRQLDESFGKADQRLTALEQSGVPAAGAMPPQPGQQPGGLAQNDMTPPGDFTGGTAMPGNPDDPANIQPAPENSLGTLTQGQGAGTQGAGGNPPIPVPINNTPEAAYESAYTALKNRQYDESERQFQAFLTRYPKHQLAANATYWMGETYYARGQFEQASRVFAEAYKTYPQSPKAADALLKLGLSLNGMGKGKEACLTYAQFKKQFPSAGPVSSRVTQEAKKIGCN